jgi:hypothetical protein
MASMLINKVALDSQSTPSSIARLLQRLRSNQYKEDDLRLHQRSSYNLVHVVQRKLSFEDSEDVDLGPDRTSLILLHF